MLEISGLVALWYLASCLAITTSKICMQTAKVPFVLCATQCLTAALATRFQLWASKSAVRLRGPSEWWAVARVSAAYSAGFGLTNVAFSLASAPFVETVKASEPVSTALFAALMLGEREAFSTYASLIPIVVGVAFATSGGGSGGDRLFSLATLVVTASNVCFSFRAIFVKHMKREFRDGLASKSAVALFHHVSKIGLPGFALAALVNRDLPALYAFLASENSSSVPLFLLALFANGLAYTAYNMASFMVLARVSTTSHAVLNVFRRVVVIAVTALYFRTPLTFSGLAGVLLAAAGVAVFATSKNA